jgi:hypothetical protein
MSGEASWGWDEKIVKAHEGDKKVVKVHEGDEKGGKLTTFSTRLTGRCRPCTIKIGGKIRAKTITIAADGGRGGELDLIVPDMDTRFPPWHMYVLQLLGEAHTLCDASLGDTRYLMAGRAVGGFGRHYDKLKDASTGLLNDWEVEHARFVQTLCDGVRNVTAQLLDGRRNNPRTNSQTDVATCKVLLNDLHWETLGLGLRLDKDAKVCLESLTVVGTVQHARWKIHPLPLSPFPFLMGQKLSDLPITITAHQKNWGEPSS